MPEQPAQVAPVRTFTVDQLAVEVYADVAQLGQAAAARAAEVLSAAVAARGSARAVFATGNSQFAFVEALREFDVPWQSVTAFHMDEYMGISADHPASFRRWIHERIEEPFGCTVHYIRGDASDAQAEADRYEALLREAPLDLVSMGVGENGHLAFNEPHHADFDDPRWVRPIALTEASRQQQVGEGHFPDLASTPDTALTVTIPALLSPGHVQVFAPEQRKAAAVAAALTGPVSNACPASVLRRCDHARLLLDPASAPKDLPAQQ